ncbi:MAG: thiamine ABC transporter substrate binding subunit [Rhodobacteraceae bacterium]|nr:thiamine ABC transporter substrate binding subunit [Paracoccaceae bacterium]
MRHSILAAGLALTIGTPALAQTPVLTVYTYDSFVTDWGPGPAVEEAFEATCNCDLEFVAAGDGAALLARLRLEGARTDADVVLGLDTNLTAAARETGLIAPHGLSADDLDLPIAWEDDAFLPFDWGYFAFVYDSSKTPEAPSNFRDLAQSDTKIIIQDPRSSTPGLGLLLWVKAAYGEDAAEVWQDLSDNIVTVTKGWSEAYGLFLEGESDMVLSYTTSPAYHLIAEEDPTKAAAAFDEGHYMQIEVAGIVEGSDQTDLAKSFLEFILSDGFQGVIPTTNWMYPAKVASDGLPDGFETLITPETSLIFDPSEAAMKRDVALAEWLSALSQ